MNHSITRLIFVLIALLTGSAATGGVPECPADRDEALWSIMNDLIMLEFEIDPISVGTLLSDDSRNGQLGDVSADGNRKRLQQTIELRQQIAVLDRSGFSKVDRLDADLLSYWLDDQIRASDFEGWMVPITGVGGPQVWLPQMGSRVRMLSEQDQKDYLTRLKRVPIVIGDTIENMRMGIEAGRVPPRVTVLTTPEQAMSQASAQIRNDPSASPFYKPFAGLDATDPVAIEAKQVIQDRIVPVYMELALFLQNEYLPACRESVGASEGVDGKIGYDAALAHHTTLNLTAEQIHERGVQEVSRIRAEMLALIETTDWFSDPALGGAQEWDDGNALFDAFTEYLRTNERFYYTQPLDLLNGYRAMSKMVDGHLPEIFSTLPSLPYGVQPLPAFSAESAPTAFYYPGSSPAGRAGNFMANLSLLDQRPKYEMLALTLHEAMPGHHLQISLAQEIEGQHPIRKRMGYSAFVEGWGLYSEKLGLEMGEGPLGLFADPYDNFGRLNFEMWRAMRLVVDTGIHFHGWSRERAIEFMKLNSALSLHNIEAEVDRYIGWPGQATAYKIGELKILELRQRAEKTLGDDFDIRAFHAVVLGDGAVPLPVLESKIDRWIASFER